MARRWVDITNDQMFKRVFGRNKELCRRLIELTLGEPIAEMEFVEAQHEAKDYTRPGGAYLDVMARTKAGELIDVEMQATRLPGIPQRARLYSARLTKEAWSGYVERHPDSYDYSKLPRVAVVFVCAFDPLGAGLRRYTGRTVYDGSPDTKDGALTVLLNARGSGDDIDPDLAAFLDYVAGKHVEPSSSAFVDDVDNAVAAGNADTEFLEGIMNMDEKLWISKQEGLEEGRAAGIAEGRAEGEATRQRKIAELAECMASDGRQDDLVATLTDGARLEEELRRYGIE